MSKQAFKRVRKALDLKVNRDPLPSYAWPGGYPIAYRCGDGEIICPDCVNKNIDLVNREINNKRDQWHVQCAFIHWEGPPEICSHCNTQIESAYGEPDEKGDE